MGTSLSIRIPDNLALRLVEISKETERSKSYHVQKALEAYLAEQAELQIALDRFHDTTDPIVSTSDIRKELGL